ncbi:RNA-directed DNA polymerase, eukaryota, reverse transcriptase zinc-binding domain protein [Tanacetum coccineum]
MLEKFNKKRDDSHLNLKRQAMDDALRKWEAQIDQLRSEEHEVIDIFSINAIADLGASVNIMSESMLDELSLADPKHANIIVKMAYKTRCVSQGIVENVLVKIDKFSFTSDFVIIDTKELNNKTIILGQPFLANIRAEINISTREVLLGIKEDRVKIKMKEQECNTAVDEHLNTRPTSQAASYGPYYEICDGGGIPDKKLKHFWKSRNDDDRITLEWEGLSCTNWLGGKIRERTLMKEQEDPKKCGETKERAIIGAVVNKLPEEWFFEVSRDKDDLKGIINYLEPTLYEGFIDHNDEAYKQRRNKLIGIPYTEPPPIKKEEAEITKYNLGVGEVFTKTNILNIKEFPRTTSNIADIRAEIIEVRNSSSEDPIQKGDIGVN